LEAKKKKDKTEKKTWLLQNSKITLAVNNGIRYQ